MGFWGWLGEWSDTSREAVTRPSYQVTLSTRELIWGHTKAGDVESCCSNFLSGCFYFVGDIALHQRDQLIEALGIAEPDIISDGCLILEAYQKWGMACAGHLLGEFSFAIWDQRNRGLVLVTDHFSSRPLCFWHSNSHFAFSNDPLWLLSLPKIARKLNRRKLAAMFTAGGQDTYPEETMHDGIKSVPPATVLTFRDQTVRCTTYWEPSIRPELIPVREDDAFEALREILFDSVRNRIRHTRIVTATLSGGLDSSALTAIAARLLEKENRSLVAVAAVLPQTGMPLRDEREFIDEFRSWPNIRIEYVDAKGNGPFDNIGDLARFESTFMITSRDYLYRSIYDAAIAAGSDVLLEGDYGELGVTNNGSGYYLEMAANFSWLNLISELTRTHPSANSPIPRWRAFRTLGGEFRSALFDNRRHSPPTILLADAFRSECSASESDPRFRPDHRQNQLHSLRAVMSKHATRLPLVALARTRVSYPLTDKRLLEFCLSASGRMKVRGGYQRNLVREALTGILPKKIQWRTSRMPFAPDYFFRYNSQLGKAREFVESIGRADPVCAIVDVKKLSDLLRPVDPMIGTFEALVQIPVTINLICFLRQFSDFR